MLRYFVRRMAFLVLTLLGATIVIFSMLHLAPGDPIDLIVGPNVTPEVRENIRHQYGLDRPLAVQYLSFMKSLLHGDLGNSIIQHKPVSELIAERFFVTLELSLTALFISFLISIPIGIKAALKRNTVTDYALMALSLIGISMPTFWFGLMLLYIVAFKLRFFPISGYGTWRHLFLPALTIGITDAALLARMVRSSMLEVIRQDYIRTARSKGLPERVVINRHALRNALIPIITLLGLRIGGVVGGSVVVEIVFARPGLGRLMVDSILARDYPVVQGVMVVLTTCIILGNLLADILYAVVDPRIKLK
ncbi:ABC transporter permease [Acetomicrobium sp.]|jgi:peptide/nickel transport system permease protein|uniref:ABC transporter permease n=1 Tax=Acetomicrobium sp. TaxID=1872099 RepID=UPI0016A3B17D|nr:ABC transporter permease [Acetomicrobium sp.]NLI43693.1 ABC transporter permease [Synergistaceae bacterium]